MAFVCARRCVLNTNEWNEWEKRHAERFLVRILSIPSTWTPILISQRSNRYTTRETPKKNALLFFVCLRARDLFVIQIVPFFFLLSCGSNSCLNYADVDFSSRFFPLSLSERKYIHSDFVSPFFEWICWWIRFRFDHLFVFAACALYDLYRDFLLSMFAKHSIMSIFLVSSELFNSVIGLFGSQFMRSVFRFSLRLISYDTFIEN